MTTQHFNTGNLNKNNMENILDTIISDNAYSLYSDLWNAIIKMFEKDGIDYMTDKDLFRVGICSNGTSTMFYKDVPYCEWTEPKIEFGLPAELHTTIRAEILLKKL